MEPRSIAADSSTANPRSRTMRTALTAVVFCLSSIVIAHPAAAGDAIDPFIGKYTGKATSKLDGKLTDRDMNFEIKKHDKGFSVRWVTIIPRKDGSTKRKSYRIRFDVTGKKKLFSAAMRRNVFGAPVPLDPIKGDPYMWASIRGKTLGVYGVHVTADGGYELQVYERTLMPGGIKIIFKRIRNGTPLKEISGFAKRKS
jgi:hypothetical protein